jgi:RNA polymerase sigma-54 factor
MAEMRHSLELKQTQKLILTQKLQHALKLLVVPTVELVDLIDQEILTNPFLEINEEATKEKQVEVQSTKTDEEGITEEQDLQDSFGGAYDIGFSSNKEFTKQDYIDKLAKSKPTLQEHLLSQLQLLSISEEGYRIGEYVIGNLDDRGFLTLSDEEIASNLDEDLDSVRNIIQMIQGFTPYGVCAHDIRESLLIQIRQYSGHHHVAENIVRECWESLVAHDQKPIMSALSLSEEELHEALEFISTLDPSPGMIFADTSNNYIIPDLSVERVGGELIVYLCDNQVPVLKINDDYLKLIAKRKSKENKDQAFLKTNLSSAKWFIRAIEQRKETLIKVMASIILKQKPFFDGTTSDLNPLTLQDIAEEVGLHFTSISRAVANKYVDFNDRIYPLKFFFCSRLSQDSGHDIATKNIKDKVKELLEGEDHVKTYSDQDLVEMLSKEGIDVARRTVTKYREQLGIPSSKFRKR